MLFSKKLKSILQCKYTYIVLFFILILYIFINTKTISSSKFGVYNDTGIIISIKTSQDKVSFVLKGRNRVQGIYYKDNNDQNNYEEYNGKIVSIEGIIKDVSNNTIPSTFNYKKYLKNNNIDFLVQVNSIDIKKEENIIYKIKNIIIHRINEYDSKISSYLKIFILGDKNSLDEDNYNNYRSNGVWHLFAISGMHISLIILVLSFLLKKIRYKNIIIILVLIYFAFMTNWAPSVIRTILFYILKLLFEKLNIKLSNIKILLLTLYLILLINPFMIFNTGLHYSFAISFALILYSDDIKGNYVQKSLTVIIICFFASLPISVNINYEINLISIISNLFFVPYISFIVFPVSLLTFIIPFLSNLLTILINFLEFLNSIFTNISIYIIIPKISLLFIIIYYILFIKLNKKYYILIITLIIHIAIPRLDSSTYIYYLDVNQGDSEVIINPYHKDVTMIDTGGLTYSNKVFYKSIILFFKSMGINKINNLIISHGDYDHMGEAINLVNNFKVEKVIFNCGEFNNLEQQLMKLLDKKKIPFYSCIKELNIDNNKLSFLQTKIYDNENDNSNVIYTEIDGYKFMFMGDAGVDTEKEILNEYNLTDIDVLKVGHHGSRTSSGIEFINEINPKYSVISVGKNNRYGHPNKEVLENLKDSIIYRTDEDGSIMFKIKNNRLKIETYRP